ncbi:HAD hydrolase-like protein [Paenibacillus sp. H1-7]|uniref:HAD hydrolase-like protein n=1 Tax=Paenibacillus sp. H1-7 TaxID=2282849 RepID=UPI001EF7793D|nr:HAD hydrolase-like protein [Paenibacillus sp. H1-7]
MIPYLERSEGERLGVITNGDLSEQRLKLERMGVLNYFEVIVASGDIGFSNSGCLRMDRNIRIGDDICRR